MNHKSANTNLNFNINIDSTDVKLDNLYLEKSNDLKLDFSASQNNISTNSGINELGGISSSEMETLDLSIPTTDDTLINGVSKTSEMNLSSSYASVEKTDFNVSEENLSELKFENNKSQNYETSKIANEEISSNNIKMDSSVNKTNGQNIKTNDSQASTINNSQKQATDNNQHATISNNSQNIEKNNVNSSQNQTTSNNQNTSMSSINNNQNISTNNTSNIQNNNDISSNQNMSTSNSNTSNISTSMNNSSKSSTATQSSTMTSQNNMDSKQNISSKFYDNSSIINKMVDDATKTPSITLTSVDENGNKVTTQMTIYKYKSELAKSGLCEEDINRIINGQILPVDLFKEIESDSNTDRLKNLMSSSYLQACGLDYYSLDDLKKANETETEELKKLVKQRDELDDREIDFCCYILNKVAMGSNLDDLLNETVAWCYTDEDGNICYTYENPYPSGADMSEYTALTFSEMYPDSKYLDDLKNVLKSTKNIWSSTEEQLAFANKIYEEYDTITSNREKQLSELDKKIEEKQEELGLNEYYYEYINSEIDYYLTNIQLYIKNSDFEANCQFNDSNLAILDSLNDKYETWDYTFGGTPMTDFSDTEEIIQIISCIVNGKGNIADGVLVLSSGKSVILESYDKNELVFHYATWSSFMNEQEVQVFNYIYNTKGAEDAYDYLNNISHELDNRWLAQQTQVNQEYATEHPYLSSIASVVVTPFEGISAACYSTTAYFTGTDIYRTDVYSSGDVFRGTVASNIAEEHPNLSFIYSTGMSMLDTAELIGIGALTGGVGLPIISAATMGSRAYVSTLNDALDRGISDGKAVALAWASATTETAMESYSAGHLLNLEGTLGKGVTSVISKLSSSIENPTLAKIATKSAYIALSATSQGIAEGEEEISTEFINYICDELIAGDLSNHTLSIQNYIDLGYSEEDARSMANNDFKSQLEQAFLGGFVSGVCFGALSGLKTNHAVSKDIANSIQMEFNGDKQSFLSNMNESETQIYTKAYEQASRLQEETENARKEKFKNRITDLEENVKEKVAKISSIFESSSQVNKNYNTETYLVSEHFADLASDKFLGDIVTECDENGNISAVTGEQLESLFFNDDYVIGIHRCGIANASDIVASGLNLTGHASSGANTNDININRNIEFFTKKTDFKFITFLNSLKDACEYKSLNSNADVVIYAIPKSEVDIDDDGDVSFKDGVNAITGRENSNPVLDSKYIYGYVHSDSRNLSDIVFNNNFIDSTMILNNGVNTDKNSTQTSNKISYEKSYSGYLSNLPQELLNILSENSDYAEYSVMRNVYNVLDTMSKSGDSLNETIVQNLHYVLKDRVKVLSFFRTEDCYGTSFSYVDSNEQAIFKGQISDSDEVTAHEFGHSLFDIISPTKSENYQQVRLNAIQNIDSHKVEINEFLESCAEYISTLKLQSKEETLKYFETHSEEIQQTVDSIKNNWSSIYSLCKELKLAQAGIDKMQTYFNEGNIEKLDTNLKTLYRIKLENDTLHNNRLFDHQAQQIDMITGIIDSIYEGENPYLEIYKKNDFRLHNSDYFSKNDSIGFNEQFADYTAMRVYSDTYLVAKQFLENVIGTEWFSMMEGKYSEIANKLSEHISTNDDIGLTEAANSSSESMYFTNLENDVDLANSDIIEQLKGANFNEKIYKVLDLDKTEKVYEIDENKTWTDTVKLYDINTIFDTSTINIISEIDAPYRINHCMNKISESKSTKDGGFYHLADKSQIKDLIIGNKLCPSLQNVLNDFNLTVEWNTLQDISKIDLYDPSKFIIEINDTVITDGKLGAISMNDISHIWAYNDEGVYIDILNECINQYITLWRKLYVKAVNNNQYLQFYQKINKQFESFIPSKNYTNTYGVDQGCIKNIINHQSKEYKQLVNKVMSSGFSKKDANIILLNIDASAGACSYANACNIIFAQFSNNTELFEDLFGISYYKTNEDGSRVLNDTELLLDMFLYMNDTHNGGNLFTINKPSDTRNIVANSSTINPKVISKKINFTGKKQLKMKENQVYLSAGNNINSDKINAYLHSKSDSLQFITSIAYDNLSKSKCSTLDIFSNMLNIMNGINQKDETISMNIFYNKNNNDQILFLNDEYDFRSSINTAQWGEGGGHSMFVTNIDMKSFKFDVSSWGRKYSISMENLFDGGSFALYTSKILFSGTDLKKVAITD